METSKTRVKIIFRSGYNDGNDFWYFHDEFKNEIFEVVQSKHDDKYLVVSPKFEVASYINKKDCQAI